MSQTENDPSANTASFQAFAQRSDTDDTPRRSAPGSRYVLIGGIVLAVIVIVVLIATL
ncbi:MAG TPA: hypothetical protein VIZ20_06475 [Streptosporangiaceae bacterium]|jgi:hypothetical protein